MRVVLGMVLFIFFLLALLTAEIGFQWDPDALAWIRARSAPCLVIWLALFRISWFALLDAWRNKVTTDLCGRKGFRGGPLLDIHGSLQLLNSSHVRERDKALLRTIVVGGVWNGFLLSHVRGQAVPCRFCGLLTMMVIFSGIVLFHLSLRFVKILSFMIS